MILIDREFQRVLRRRHTEENGEIATRLDIDTIKILIIKTSINRDIITNIRRQLTHQTFLHETRKLFGSQSKTTTGPALRTNRCLGLRS